MWGGVDADQSWGLQYAYIPVQQKPAPAMSLQASQLDLGTVKEGWQFP